MLLSRETFKTNWQTESHHMKQQLAVQHFHLKQICFAVHLDERHKSSSSIWYTSDSRDLYRIRCDLWRKLDKRRDRGGLARHRELRRVKGSRKIAGCTDISCADGTLR